MDRSMKIMTVFVVLLLMSVTIPLSYLLMKNVGMEKVRVMKNEILASDVDTNGHTYLLVRQYYEIFTGYRSANEFISNKKIMGYQPNNNQNMDNRPMDIFLLIKDVNDTTVERHILKKNTVWSHAAIRIFNGEIYIVWNEYQKSSNGQGYTDLLKYRKIGVNNSIDEVLIYSVYSTYHSDSFQLEIIPDPTRVVIDYWSGLFVVNGSSGERLIKILPSRLFKTQDSHLHFIGGPMLVTYYNEYWFYLYEMDEKFNIIHQENLTTRGVSLFQANGMLYIFFVKDWPSAIYSYTNYLIHPIGDGPINTSDNSTQMIDNVTGLAPWTVHPIMRNWNYPLIITTDDLLLIFHGKEDAYPMKIDIYDTGNNFSRKEPQYFNFTIQNVLQVGSSPYLIGYVEQWTLEKDFPQLIIQKLEIQ
jgi:hypothetical protein